MKLKSVFVGLFAMFVTAVPLLAHHATQAEFDKDKVKIITGKLTKVLWINPHANWHMEVKNEKGVLEDWTIVAAGPGGFRAAGLSQKDYFKVGETYTASIALSHNGSLRGHIITWQMPDGRKVSMWWEGNDPLKPTVAN